MKKVTGTEKTAAHLIVLMIMLLFICAAWQLAGCGSKPDKCTGMLLPEFGNILPVEEDTEEERDTEEEEMNTGKEDTDIVVVKTVPVNVFMDNTGSMAGYTINKFGQSAKPSAEYEALMRSIRDMGMTQETKYYVTNPQIMGWKEYKDGLFENFRKAEFYLWWQNADAGPGPLTKLYMEERLDNQCINVVLTDLSEQNLNNTKLAEQIQKMCTEGQCEADLYAFKFVFNGNTQVPAPDSMSKMLNVKIVNKKKPYYMIITGPSDAMSQYRKGIRAFLKRSGLEAGKHYHTATSRTKLNQDRAVLSDVVFRESAGYEEIDEEHRAKEQAEKEENETKDSVTDDEQDTVNMDALTKNLTEIEDIAGLFEKSPEMEMKAYEYSRVEGISKDEFDWRLLFQVPLKGRDKSDLEYSYDYHIYTLTEAETESEEETRMEWAEDSHSGIEVAGSIDDASGQYCFSVSGGGNAENEDGACAALVLLSITKKETYTYRMPKWVDKFDTGNTDNYYTRTFNLKGFYNVLFSGGKGFLEGRENEITSSYIQIPILLIRLNQQ